MRNLLEPEAVEEVMIEQLKPTSQCQWGKMDVAQMMAHCSATLEMASANPNHTRPASIAEIGNHGPANHEYDLEDFFGAVSAGNYPAVSFLKAQAYEDGHAGYSNPLDEQNFLVRVINFLQTQQG